MSLHQNKTFFMYRLFVLIGVIFFCVACEKEITATKRSARELLTEKEWVLASYGYDDNKNGNIDASEENIKECEKDNNYLFKNNGSGYVFDNILKCGNGVSDHTFNWYFINGDTALDFVFGTVKILLLSENELVVYHDVGTGSDAIRFFVKFNR
jgi:hypothetical protein